MKPRLLSNPKTYAFGNKTIRQPEASLQDLDFTIHRFSGRPRPDDRKKRLFISCFSEFGCEVIGVLYSIPRLLQRFPGMHATVLGWHGREYLYRHLVDEFWEIKPEHMWLREYCRAFHHSSRNLARLEDDLFKEGIVVGARYLGRTLYATFCLSCGNGWVDYQGTDKCKVCNETQNLKKSLFGNIEESRKSVRMLPSPSESKMRYAASLLGKKPVGVFARGRKCYGRNLPPEFYERLVALLIKEGYTPIWLGEEATTQACPVEGVVDFSRMKESRDLETTLAIIKQCEFTVQFWTASSRLAGLMGVPYLLVESPGQLWDGKDQYSPGQEGYRLHLSTFGPKKIIASNFKAFYESQDSGLALVEKAIVDIRRGDYRDIIGLVDDEEAALRWRSKFYKTTRLPEDPWKT